MAGFCRNCGTALGDGQAFCTKCGARLGEAPAQPAAQAPPQASTPAAAPQTPVAPQQAAAPGVAPASAVPPASKGSPFVKILLILVGVFVLFGFIAFAAVLYVGHRIHQKAQEMGLTADSAGPHVSTLGGVNACALLSKDDVSQAVGMEVVRAEPDHGDRLSCTYSVQGDAGDLTTKHAIRMSQRIAKNSGGNQQQMTKSQQDDVENIGKSLFHGVATAQDSGLAEHQGESPVFSFSINDDAAQFQMKIDRVAFSRIGPVGAADIPNLGDDAFDAAGAMMLVRKGDKIVRVMYMQCPCVEDDVVPLVRKVLSGLP